MSVNRYEMKTTYRGHDSWDSLEEDDDGSYVRYEDYTELEQKLTDMAVQLSNAESKCRGLSARAVNLPKRSVGEVMHMSGFSRDYAEGWCAGNDNAIHEIRAAGIGVKGE